MFDATSQSHRACGQSLPTGQPPFHPCLDFQPRLRQQSSGRTHPRSTRIWLACRACVTCGGWHRFDGSLVHIAFRLFTQAIQSTVTRTFAREERTQLRTRVESQTPHLLQSQELHVELVRYGCQNTRNAAQRERVLSHVSEWLLKAMSTHFWAKPAVRLLQKRAEVSLSSSNAYSWNDELLRIFEVMLCVFCWIFCISLSEYMKYCRIFLTCDVSVRGV